uniref:Uncharacterized protein n=1 Tax=Anguilla anguilla TaxID=7936 RepID=A0A0E9QBG6_ANGAN
MTSFKHASCVLKWHSTDKCIVRVD